MIRFCKPLKWKPLEGYELQTRKPVGLWCSWQNLLILNARHMSFKFWLSLLHKCHMTGGYVTCSLFHNKNNGILLLLWNFRIKTNKAHLLVAEGKSLHSFQTSLDLLSLSSSSHSKLKESKKVLDPFQCLQRMLHCSSYHTEGIQSSTWGTY